jgi:UDP-N-acetylmuramoylalanine--D-glutamate ligase
MRPEIQQLQLPLPIAIVGLGISGDAAVQLLKASGIPEDQILTFDQKGPAQFQNPEELMKSGSPKTLCVSPGVPLQSDWIQAAIQSGVRITSELEIAFAFLENEKVISVTGSVGKSTTTSILGAGALKTDPNCFVGGNLGLPLAKYSLELLQATRQRAQYVVLELSSYQLENFKNLKSDLSILTHLSPNHLERYTDLNHYFATKLQLFKQTKTFGILNRSGGSIAALVDKIQKANPHLKWSWTDRNDPAFKKELTEKPALVGSHNMDNLALAFAAAKFLSWPAESFKAMLQFPGLSHRLENCGKRNGILFLNDSKATSIDSVMQALQSVRHEYPDNKLHLLLGGKDKNLPWENLKPLEKTKNISISFFGQVAPVAQQKSTLAGPQYARLADCLSALKPQLNAGDIVLLSPGGTSWDEFKNFEERGDFFKKWISSEFNQAET